MAYKKKHEGSKVRSIRVSDSMFDFLRSFNKQQELSRQLLTANDFVVDLIENSTEYHQYLINKNNEVKQPALF
jgi:hypothetical protein